MVRRSLDRHARPGSGRVAYLLVGIYGGPRRAYAAIKFVIYTSVGSLLMLIGIIAVGAVVSTNSHTAFTLDLFLHQLFVGDVFEHHGHAAFAVVIVEMLDVNAEVRTEVVPFD